MRVCGWIGRQICEWGDMEGEVDVWLCGQMGGRVDGWMDE